MLSTDFQKDGQKIPILSMLNLRRKSARFSEMGLIYVETTSVWTNHNTFTLFNSIDSIMVSGEELFAIQKR